MMRGVIGRMPMPCFKLVLERDWKSQVDAAFLANGD
jgi:hypothetical protein